MNSTLKTVVAAVIPLLVFGSVPAWSAGTSSTHGQGVVVCPKDRPSCKPTTKQHRKTQAKTGDHKIAPKATTTPSKTPAPEKRLPAN